MKLDLLASKYGSIQEWLTKEGKFSVDTTNQQFVRYKDVYNKIAIPFSSLRGHTVDSFAKTAKRNGWLPDDVAKEIDKLYGAGE